MNIIKSRCLKIILLSLVAASAHAGAVDGFYEQRLIREQIGQLTGRRFLENYSNDEQQYQALMSNGATFAQTHQLIPGAALTEAQVAQLTSDIVWLELIADELINANNCIPQQVFSATFL